MPGSASVWPGSQETPTFTEDHMADTFEQRIKDLEDLMFDLPNILNLRLESLGASHSEITARLGLIDKQGGMIQRDMRDLRGGVTRQLVEQDKRLSAIETRLAVIDGKLDAILARLPG